MTKNDRLAALLRSLADLVEASRSTDLQDLFEGKAKLRIVSEKSHAKRAPRTLGDAELQTVKRKLEAAKSEEEGLRVLEAALDGSRDLHVQLARSYEVSSRRSDKIDELAQAIVKAVVGSRIQSETIRALSL